jgi:hypothetical protein
MAIERFKILNKLSLSCLHDLNEKWLIYLILKENSQCALKHSTVEKHYDIYFKYDN